MFTSHVSVQTEISVSGLVQRLVNMPKRLINMPTGRGSNLRMEQY